MALYLVEGWTERISYALSADGAPVDLTGSSVDLIARSRHGQLLDVTGAVGVEDHATGKVFFDPAPYDIVAADAPLSIRWKVTDAAGKIAFFPNSNVGEQWNVSPA